MIALVLLALPVLASTESTEAHVISFHLCADANAKSTMHINATFESNDGFTASFDTSRMEFDTWTDFHVDMPGTYPCTSCSMTLTSTNSDGLCLDGIKIDGYGVASTTDLPRWFDKPCDPNYDYGSTPCTGGSFTFLFDEAPFASSTVDVLDLAVVDPDLSGFFGGFQDGTYGYVVPSRTGATGGKVARFELEGFTNVEVLDLTATDPDLMGFNHGFQDGTYGYLVPWHNGNKFGKVARFELQGFSNVQVLDLSATDPDLKGFRGGFEDGTYGYVVPFLNEARRFGKVARFDLQGFTHVEVLDLEATDPDLRGFHHGFQDGTYGYMVPHNREGAYSGKVARFELQGFSNVQVLDLAATDTDLMGFHYGFHDGTHGYMVPFYNGRDFSGKVARFELQGFTNVEVLDLTATHHGLKGFASGFQDGTYGYMVPLEGDGSKSGLVARFELQGFSNVQVLDLAATDPGLKGFTGSFFSGRYAYCVPYSNPAYSGKVARFELQAPATSTATRSSTTATSTSSTATLTTTGLPPTTSSTATLTTTALPPTTSSSTASSATGDCTTAGTLEDVAESMRKVMADARQRAASRSEALTTSAAAIVACPTDTEAGSLDGIPANDTAKGREDHTSCRLSEVQKRLAADTACDAVARFWDDVVVPPCATPAEPRSFNDSLACVLVLTNWSRDVHTELLSRNAACDGNTTAAKEQRQECAAAQATFEGLFCAFRSGVISACDGCYEERKGAHTALVSEAVQNETNDKLAYGDAELSLCELGVFNETANLTRKQELREACRKLVPDTSVLDIDWPEVPEDVECNATVVESKPCDDDWMEREYNQSWAVKAPAAECTPCQRKLAEGRALEVWNFI